MYKYFEKVFDFLLLNITNNLAEEFIDYVHEFENCYQISTLSSKYNYNELKRLAKNCIIKDFKPLIIDVLLREISQILFDKFSYKFAKELLVCFHELLKKHKKIKEIFTVRGAENTITCMKKIKNLMNYPKDDYEERNPKIKEKKDKKSKYEEFAEDEE